MKLYLIFILIFTGVSVFPQPQNNEDVIDHGFFSNRNIQVGEELTYVVKYSVMKLGEVRIKVKEKKTVNGKTYYVTNAYIDSYSGVPFVNLHQVYESFVDTNIYSDFFKALIKSDDYTSYTEYDFNYRKSEIHIKKGKVNPPQIWTDSTTSVNKKYQDGLSIFYYARMNIGKVKSVDVPCFVNENKVFTKLNFYDTVESVSVDAVDYEVACMKLDGETNFISVFGLTGYFEGWFSADEAAIPLVAKMKVIIGNITLELLSWKREGWKPPEYKK
jgi:Protein of unknown function (DUF3108)